MILFFLYDKIIKNNFYKVINMDRISIENNIKNIISLLKNEKLSSLLQNSISDFSDEDLLNILEFLKNGNLESLINFLQEKTKDFMWEVQAIKFAKGKITIWKNIRIEKNERKEEEKELENLLNQL